MESQPEQSKSPACAILAGGQATRYGGENKGLLDIGRNTTIIERLIAEVELAGIEEIVIVTDDSAPYAHLPRQIIGDLRGGAGPLGGIEAAMNHFSSINTKTDAVLILPCDLPAIGWRQMKAIVSAYVANPRCVAVATAGGKWHWLCAAASVNLLGEVTTALDSGIRRVGQVWRKAGAIGVEFGNSKAFFNVNSPCEMAQWRGTDG